MKFSILGSSVRVLDGKFIFSKTGGKLVHNLFFPGFFRFLPSKAQGFFSLLASVLILDGKKVFFPGRGKKTCPQPIVVHFWPVCWLVFPTIFPSYSNACLENAIKTWIAHYRPRSEGDNALGSVRPSVRPSVCNALLLEPFYLWPSFLAPWLTLT